MKLVRHDFEPRVGLLEQCRPLSTLKSWELNNSFMRKFDALQLYQYLASLTQKTADAQLTWSASPAMATLFPDPLYEDLV